MIITCPSCSTRYHPPAEVGESPFTCSCSRCESIFPFEPISGDAVLAIDVRLDPEPPVMAIPPVLPEPDLETECEVGLTDLPIGMDDPTLAPQVRDAVTEPPVATAAMTSSVLAVEKPVQATRPVAARPRKNARPGFFAFLIVALLPTAMAAGAWQLSTTYGEDPMVWTTPAGVLGLLFSWLWVRWKYREN